MLTLMRSRRSGAQGIFALCRGGRVDKQQVGQDLDSRDPLSRIFSRLESGVRLQNTLVPEFLGTPSGQGDMLNIQ